MANQHYLRETGYWLDQVKGKYECKSDGELSRLLGVTKAAVSLQRAGKHEMSIKQAVKVAELLHVNPMCIICGVMYHQDPAEAEFWTSVYEQTVQENDRRRYFPETD